MAKSERAVYIIKPEAIHFRESIRSELARAGIRVVESSIMVLPHSIVEKIYPGISRTLRRATVASLTGRPAEIGIVEGVDVVRKLAKLAGDSPDPTQCDPATIRFRFGVHEPVRYQGTLYYLNGFHRSLTAEEAERDLEAYRSVTRRTDTGPNGPGVPRRMPIGSKVVRKPKGRSVG